MREIVCLSYLPWQARPTRTQQILSRLQDTEILFVEPARRDRPREDLRKVRPNITVCTLPSALAGPEDKTFVSRRRMERNIAFLQRQIRDVGFENWLLWCSSPAHFPFPAALSPEGVIYDCDRLWDEDWQEEENALTAQADVVLAASSGLKRRLSLCSSNIAVLPNGVNPSVYGRPGIEVAPALLDLERPIIGRVGDLNERTQLEPLLYAALRKSEWQFVLIGRTTSQVRRALAKRKNIHLLGPVNPLDVPEYLAGCDVLFDLCQRDQYSSDVLPIRVFEYLATGKPILLMSDPEAGDLEYGDVIYTAYDDPGFFRWLGLALEEKPSKAPLRREYSRLASWKHRAEAVETILTNTGFF